VAVAVTVLAQHVTGLALDGEHLVLTLDEVQVLADNRGDDVEVPTTVAIDVGSLYDTTPTVEALRGLSIVVFAHGPDDVYDGLVGDVEGVWLACGTTGPAQSVIASSVGDGWPANPTLATLRAAIVDG